MFKVEPYLPGRGPVIEFRPDDDTWRNGVIVSIDPDGAVTERFRWTQFKPGAGAITEPRHFAAIVLGFIAAYVERPDEFDRQPGDTEQLHAAWWLQHCDNFACETGDDADA